jgi:hypothetical protein
VIEAAALLDDRSSIEVRLIGEGPLRPDLEQLVGELTMTETVRFDFFLNASAMPVALADVDVLVVPPTRDMRVLVATEAMAAGAVPVVSSATAVWGAGDLVQHGVTGFVYPAGDIDCLAATLQRLVDDEQLRATVSAAAMRAVAVGDEVTGFEVDEHRASRLAAGASHVPDVPDAEVRAGLDGGQRGDGTTGRIRRARQSGRRRARARELGASDARDSD